MEPTTTQMRSTDFSTDLLDATAMQIAETILTAAYAHRGTENLSGGGCLAFYDAEDWAGRREDHGNGAPLVVVHDGGSLASFFNWDYEDTAAVAAVDKALAAIGYYAEQCTCWFTAIYKIG